jgi:hypothetical protein
MRKKYEDMEDEAEEEDSDDDDDMKTETRQIQKKPEQKITAEEIIAMARDHIKRADQLLTALG